MERGAWRPTVHGVSKCRTQLKGLSMHTYILIVDSCCPTAETNNTIKQLSLYKNKHIKIQKHVNNKEK